MDYLYQFNPLIGYVAHLCHTSKFMAGMRTLGEAEASDMACLLSRARNGCTAVPASPEIWRVIHYWLERSLEKLPGGKELAGRLMPGPAESTADFFARLDRLLDTPGRRPADANRRMLAGAYFLCLASGTLGDCRSGAIGPRLERCRDYLSMQPLPVSCNSGRVDLDAKKAASLPLAAWAAPVLVTLALYTVYRLVLTGLYAGLPN